MPKERKRQAEIIKVLAANMKAVFAFADRVPETRDRSTPERLCEWIDEQRWGDRMGKTTVYKMLRGTGPVVIDQLELVARAFDLEAWHLLVPGLDPANPPYLVRSEQERELWRSIVKVREAALEEATKREDAREDRHSESPTDGATDHAAGSDGGGGWKRAIAEAGE